MTKQDAIEKAKADAKFWNFVYAVEHYPLNDDYSCHSLKVIVEGNWEPRKLVLVAFPDGSFFENIPEVAAEDDIEQARRQIGTPTPETGEVGR